MMGWQKRSLAVLILSGLGAALSQAALAQEPRLMVELNKTEAADDGGCRAFFLFRNQTGMSFEGFEMSLAILDTNGVIDRLLSIDAAPVPAARTTLKLFEIPQIGCDSISEILLHEVPSCRPQNEPERDCFELIALSSRASAQLVK